MSSVPETLILGLSTRPETTAAARVEAGLALGFSAFEIDAEIETAADTARKAARDAHARIAVTSIGHAFDRARARRFRFGLPADPLDLPTEKDFLPAFETAQKAGSRIVVISGVEVLVDDAEAHQRTLAAAIHEAADPADRRKRIESVLLDRAKRRDLAVELFARLVYALARRFPDLTPAIAPHAHPLALFGVDETLWILEETRRAGVRYFHDVAQTALRELWGLETREARANIIDRYAVGTYVSDVHGFEAGRVPGMGTLPLKESLRAIPPALVRVLKVKEPFDTLDLVGALESLG